ncbi:MAG: 50S ribosome-binding GTPase [Clostridia bacterium]|nr:50S ribosome-binding GTPase [Clostridia bacterium]
MEDSRKINVLVLGNSGVGKSTLIKAVSGTEIQTGTGEGNTQKIDVYESNTWPLRFIDTKGFEYKKLEQIKTIFQIKKFTKEQVELSKNSESQNTGIDVVWYCIEGTSRRFFADNIKMMNTAIRGWKNIPVFAVITKSYSESDIEDNISAVESAFSKIKNINLQKIVPVVAQEYEIDEEKSVLPKGIDELCSLTLECSDEAVKISSENQKRMILEQKRIVANLSIGGAATAGVLVGAAPISFADSLILVPLETALIKSIFKTYGIDFSGELISAVIGSAAITNVAKASVSALKTIPNIAGNVLNAVVAGFFVGAIGEAVAALCEAIYLEKIEKDEIDRIIDFVAEKIKDNSMLSFAVRYIQKNSEKLVGKSAKEIFKTIDKAVKKEKDSI